MRCDWPLNATVTTWRFPKWILLSGAFLSSFGRRRRADLGGAVTTYQFAGRVKHGITGLLARRIVTVHNLVQKRAVFGALGLFQKASPIVILVTALETQPAIRSGDFPAGKTSCLIQLVTNRFAEFAIWVRGCRHGFVLRVVELVNGARTIWVH